MGYYDSVKNLFLKEEKIMSVKKMLAEEIESKIESLKDLDHGSEEYHKGIDDVSKMLDKYIDMDKIDREYRDREDSRINENANKALERRSDRIERVLKYGLSGLTFGVSIFVTLWINKDSKMFEQEGYTHTTEAGRLSTRKLLNLLDKFR